MPPLKILLAASEVAPFAKTGGLADVSAALGRYLGRAGHDVRVFLPLYRRIEPNAQLMEFRCIEFVEELAFGDLRRQQLVKHYEGETLNIDITRKIPRDPAILYQRDYAPPEPKK